MAKRLEFLLRKKISFFLTLFIFSILFILPLFQKGLFVDGLIYAAISRNLAEGIGLLWAPYYTEYMSSAFYEHPPLFFWLESLFFRLFGDQFWVERLFSLLLLVGCLVLIYRIATQLKESDKWKYLFFWLCIPLVGWAFSNNMLDTMLCFFTLAACGVYFRDLRKGRLLWSSRLLGGFLIVCALMAKGPMALFPVALPFIYFLVYSKSKWQKGLSESIILAILVGLLFCIQLIPEGAAELWLKYLDQQVVAGVSGQREVADSHFYILWVIIQQLFPLVIIAALFALLHFLGLFSSVTNHGRSKDILFFTLIALSASLPIMLSSKQMEFYMLTSSPYFAISIGLFISSFKLKRSISKLWLNGMKLLLIVGTAMIVVKAVADYGSFQRDQELQLQLQKVTGLMKEPDLCISNSLQRDWRLHAYAQRNEGISLKSNCEGRSLLLVPVGEAYPEMLLDTTLSSNKYDVYKRGLDNN